MTEEIECIIKIDDQEFYHGQLTEADMKKVFDAAVANVNLRNTWKPTKFALYVRKRHMRGQLRVMHATVPAPVSLPD